MTDEAAAARSSSGSTRLQHELVDEISKAVRIPSVNPKYPGQVYDDVVGGEGEVSKLVAEVYKALGADVDVWAIEPGRENAVGVVPRRGRRPLADLQRPRRRRARPAIPPSGRAAIRSRAASTATASGAAARPT